LVEEWPPSGEICSKLEWQVVATKRGQDHLLPMRLRESGHAMLGIRRLSEISATAIFIEGVSPL
jgi:hypothetical protein